MSKRYIVFFFFVLLLGLAIRFFFILISPKTLFWDEYTYTGLADRVIQGGSAIDCCNKGSGYPVVLAVLNRFFGSGNLLSASILNICFDVISGILIFLISKNIYSKKIACISILFFAINPFTSSYTGFILPESLTIMLLTMFLFTITNNNWNKKMVLWFFAGMLLAVMIFVRLSLQGYAYIMLVLFFITAIKTQKLNYLLLLVAGFLIGSSYSLIGYYSKFGVISILPPYQISIPTTIYSSKNQGRYPEQLPVIEHIDPTYRQVKVEFDTALPSEIPGKNLKYSKLFWSGLKTDWRIYVKMWLKNMIWLWDKYFIIIFVDPIYPVSILPMRILNIIILFFSFFGFFYSLIKRKNESLNRFVITSSSLFLYITFIFTLVSNETRHTIFFYPILMIFSAYGVSILPNVVGRLIKKNVIPKIHVLKTVSDIPEEIS